MKVPSGSESFQDASAKRGLSKNEEGALAFLSERESATAVEVSEAIGISRRGATKLMGRLADANRVEPIESQRTRGHRVL